LRGAVLWHHDLEKILSLWTDELFFGSLLGNAVYL
jgi:hypothetical protein